MYTILIYVFLICYYCCMLFVFDIFKPLNSQFINERINQNYNINIYSF